MKLLFKRSQTTGKVVAVQFKLWAKVEFEGDESTVVAKYKIAEAALIGVLQPDDELLKLGQMLINGTAKPLDFFPISLVQISTRGVQHNHSPIFQVKEIPDIENEQLIKLPIFRFYLDGLIIHFDCDILSSGGNCSSNPVIVGANKELLISTVEFAISSQRVNLQNVMREATSWPKGYKPPRI